MNSIKFSEDYEKLPLNWQGTQAVLIAVTYWAEIKDLQNRLPAFIEYDTKYRNKPGHYVFDFKDTLILTFIHINSGKPFTTIRRWTPEKEEYYKKSIGQTYILEKTK